MLLEKGPVLRWDLSSASHRHVAVEPPLRVRAKQSRQQCFRAPSAGPQTILTGRGVVWAKEDTLLTMAKQRSEMVRTYSRQPAVSASTA